MPAFKCEFIFSMEPNGWSESYWWTGTGDINACITDASLLGFTRRLLLATEADLDAIRIVDPTSPGAATLVVTGNAIGSGRTNPDPLSSPWMSLVCNSNDTSRIYRASHLLRGLPFGYWEWDTTRPGNGVLNANASNAFNQFRSVLCSGRSGGGNPNLGNWYINAKSLNPISVETTSLTDIGPTSTMDPRITISLATARSWLPGQAIHIHGVTGLGLRGVNGNTNVAVRVSSTEFIVQKAQVIPQDVKWYGKGVVYRTDIDADPSPTIQDINFERFAKRNTGRSFFVTRGRRRTQKT